MDRPEIGTTVSWRMGHNGQLRSGVVTATAEDNGRVTVQVDKDISTLTKGRWISTEFLIGFGEPYTRSTPISWHIPFRYSGD